MRYFFLNEVNGIVQLVTAALAIALAVGLRISTTEWLFVIMCIGFVIGLEMLNTAVENLCNVVQEEYHPIIKIVKDVAAAAVMWVAVMSLIIGAIIFLPKIL